MATFANRSEVALKIREAYSFAWKGDSYHALDVLANPGKDLWMNFGRAQLHFSIAMGTGTDKDLEVARNALKDAEKLATEIQEANSEGGTLSSVWKSLWDGDAAPAEITPEQRRRMWDYFASLVCQAEINLNLLSLCFKERQWMSIGLTARRSWKLFEEADQTWKKIKKYGEHVLPEADRLEEVDILSRLEFGIGLYHFFVSLVPPGLLVIVEAIGFQANRQLGISELKSAVSRKGIHYVTASLLLVAYHNFFMQEDDPANSLISALVDEGYHTSPAIRLMGGTVARRQGNIARAIESYQLGTQGVKNQPQVVLILEAELGNTYFLDGNWSQAAGLFERFVKNTTNRQYKCFSLWRLGFCWWMMNVENRVEKVTEINRQVIELADDRFAYEKFSARIAKRFIDKKRYTGFEELWFHAWSWNQASRFQDSTDVLQKGVDIVKKQSAMGDKATELPLAMVECVSLCLYLKTSNYNGLEKLNEASESLQKLLQVQNEIVDELWVIPHAYVEMAELCLKRAAKGIDQANMYKKAGICFDRAKTFSDYDFERPLSFRIARGKDLLRNVPSS